MISVKQQSISSNSKIIAELCHVGVPNSLHVASEYSVITARSDDPWIHYETQNLPIQDDSARDPYFNLDSTSFLLR